MHINRTYSTLFEYVLFSECPEHCTKCTLTSAKVTRCSSGYCESGYTTNGDGSLCLSKFFSINLESLVLPVI